MKMKSKKKHSKKVRMMADSGKIQGKYTKVPKKGPGRAKKKR